MYTRILGPRFARPPFPLSLKKQHITRGREMTEIERAKTNCAHQEIHDSRETKTNTSKEIESSGRASRGPKILLLAASILPESKTPHTMREREKTEIERAKTHCAHKEINDKRETKTNNSKQI